jgi:hypothetical protein
MAHDVFISYSSKDQAVADAACASLERRGFRCWLASRDITPSADYGEAIIDGITGARAFVLLLSAASNASQQVRREVERAVHLNLPIVAMRIEKVELAKSLEYFLATPQRFDALTRPLDPHLDYLGGALEHILKGAAAPRPVKRAQMPAFLQDRRVLIGGGAALAIVAVLSTWLSISSATPPTFTGKWTAEKVTLSGGTFQANGIAFATDYFINAAFKGEKITGSFDVDGLGQYRYVTAAEDTGVVSATKDKITFTSDQTGETKSMGYFLIGTAMAAGMVSAYGGKEGDLGLVLNPPAPWVQASLVGKPLYAFGTPLQKISGEWRFKSQVNGMVATPQVTLAISEDGRYRFRGEFDEKGLWTAGDGKWTRTAQGAFQPVTGTYAFEGRDRVTTAAAIGTTVWVRAD